MAQTHAIAHAKKILRHCIPALVPTASCAPELHFMGAVHGVHLKYLAMSATCATGAWRIGALEAPDHPDHLLLAKIAFPCLVYAALTHALITTCFLLRRGEWILGKDEKTGALPLWCAG